MAMPPTNPTGDPDHPQASDIKIQTNSKQGEAMPHSTVSTTSIDSTAKTSLGYDLEKNALAPLPLGTGLDPADFPEGGKAAWLVVLGAWCGLFCSFGWLNSIGVFQEYYQFHQFAAYSPSAIAWIPSMELFIMFFAGPVAGKLFDNFGPRYVLLAGSVIQVFGLMMASLSEKYYQIFLAQGVVAGLGGSFIFFACVASIPSWFYARRAAALGLVSTGASIGGVVFPIMLRKSIPRIGFGWAMRIAAFTILGLLVIANSLVRSRIEPHPKPVKASDLWKPMTESPFAMMVLGSVFFNFGTYIPYNYIMLYARKYDMDLDLITYLLPIMSGASVFGRVIPGFLADKVGKFNMMILTTGLSTILVLALWLPSRGNAAIIVFAALYGFTSGSFVSLGPALVAQLCDVREIGVRSGVMFLLVSVSCLTGNPIAGALLGDGRDDFVALMVFCAVVMGLGTTLFYASRWSLVGSKWAVV